LRSTHPSNCDDISYLTPTSNRTPKRPRTDPAPGQRGGGRPSKRDRGSVAARILTLNIAAAAEPRAARILRWLRARNDDLIVLSETSGGPGTELLRRGLEADGYATFATAYERERGVLVASRLPVRETIEEILVTLPCRAKGIVLERSLGLAVVGIYVPSRDRSPEKVARKQEFLASLLASIRSLPEELRRCLLLLGDYNAVARHHTPSLSGFFPYEYEFHDELEELGLCAAHELKPYGGHPHSWIGRTGIGYLYDYAHLGGALGSRLERCQYLHGPRQQRLSDHAALAVRLRLD
jgi:exodeoxyribonuclease III